jgi:3-phenylpropionate/trans-cinnamate dioxygenase ferredoxin reductase subunit
LPDADGLRADLSPAARVVVIGAGWIGLEAAAAARHHGAEVTVVEMDSAPLRRVLGDEVAAVFAELHRAQGVTFRFGTGVREFRAGDDGRLAVVVLTDGTELPADLAVVGVGISPATELAEAAGLAVENGVAVDAGLRTSDPDVFAAGDVAAFTHPALGRRIRVEHWSNALNGGAAAAHAMLGEEVAYDQVPYFFTDQYDLGMEFSGWIGRAGYDRLVTRGDVEGQAFHAFWLADGRVVAGMQVNLWDEGIAPVQELIRSRQPVDPNRLADTSVPLASHVMV